MADLLYSIVSRICQAIPHIISSYEASRDSCKLKEKDN